MRKWASSFLWPVGLNLIARYVSELLYIHSKVMIVDDRRVIVRKSEASTQGILILLRRWDQLTSTIAARR